MNLKRILIISRPVAWVWTIGAFLAGIGNFNNFTTLSIIEFLFMLLPINFIVYGINDIYDRKSDSINPNKDGIQGAKIKPNEIKEIKKISIIFSVLFILIAITSKNLEHIAISSTLIFFAYIYSTPPLRLKTRPFLDAIFGSIGYLFPAIIAFTTYNSISNIPFHYAILAIPLIGMHATFALRDIKYDKKDKTKTTGTFLGKKTTLILSSILYLITAIIIDEIFLKSILITLALMETTIIFTDLKKGKYILPLISTITFVITLTFVQFILKANFG